MSKDKYFDLEEHFHSSDDRKTSRKEKKIASEKDRSKYKKTDADKRVRAEAAKHHDHSDLMSGQVLAINPEGIFVFCEETLWTCQLKGSLKKEKNKAKNLVAVGDIVLFEKKDNMTGSIAHIQPRSSILSRADNLSRKKEQLIAVNVDLVIITCSVVSPAVKPSLIDRYIIAARKGNMTPIIAVNKIDLLGDVSFSSDVVRETEQIIFDEMKEAYQAIGVPVVGLSTKTQEGIDELKSLMKGKTSVFSGQSGVGKSSLINAVTGSDLRTGDIVSKTCKGSHTTTSTHLIPIEGGGFCIDTPGIKSFGVWDLDEDELWHYYEELIPFAKGCKFPDCKHKNEPGCAVMEAVERGEISALRFASYSALMADLEKEHRNR